MKRRACAIAGLLLVARMAVGKSHVPRPDIPELPYPTRPLEWGDVNFLSTSDTHGWLLGHQHATWPEPNYSGDFGDFASFATHMRAIAASKGVDLLLVDAGDHHDGSGLVSSTPTSAAQADEIFGMIDYDVLTIGNHELYQYDSALDIHLHHKDRWKGRYLTSNVNLTVWEDGEKVSRPVAEQYRKFRTTTGRKVTAFGVIFDFKAHDRNLTIQSPRALSRESWFERVIEDAPDYFILAGHMPARGETAEWEPIVEAIRRKHPSVPIFIFGGHTHVRDCVQHDDHSISVVPGRYMETIAFTSSSLASDQNDSAPLRMRRRYLDANRRTYKWHTNSTAREFDTELGLNITTALFDLAVSLNLSTPLGTAPHDFFLARYPYGHERNVLTEWARHVIPATVTEPARKGEKRVIIGNAGSLRFDIFAGTFDRNDELTLSPFLSRFVYTRLPAGLAKQIEPEMNRRGATKLVPASENGRDDGEVKRVYDEWMRSQWEDFVAEQRASASEGDQSQTAWGLKTGSPTLGYLTRDACEGKGDDIDHIPIPYSPLSQPDFIATPFPKAEPEEEIDVVVMDFSLDDFFIALHALDPGVKLEPKDMLPYADGLQINVIWGMYAGMAWQG